MNDFLGQFDVDPSDENVDDDFLVSPDPIYIDKRQPCDMDVVVQALKIFKSENPKHLGEERFIAELLVKNKRTGQPDLIEGEVASYYINMSTKQNSFAAKKSYQELTRFLAIVSGKSQRDLIGNATELRAICEDDGVAYQGVMLNMTTGPANKDGWRSLIFERVVTA